MPVDHYENFPVASLLVPARLRQSIEVIYRFARSADDILWRRGKLGLRLSAARCARLQQYVEERLARTGAKE